jgi:hypothetical protein
MQRISSRMTFYYKRVFPFVMLGFVALFIALPFVVDKGPPLPAILIPIAFVVIGYFIMKKLIFDLVDEAWDAGDALIIRNKGQEDRIPLSAIMNVSYTSLMNPPRVTLTLRTPSLFGDTVTFAAPIRFVPFASSPIIDELIRRVDDARRRAR